MISVCVHHLESKTCYEVTLPTAATSALASSPFEPPEAICPKATLLCDVASNHTSCTLWALLFTNVARNFVSCCAATAASRVVTRSARGRSPSLSCGQPAEPTSRSVVAEAVVVPHPEIRRPLLAFQDGARPVERAVVPRSVGLLIVEKQCLAKLWFQGQLAPALAHQALLPGSSSEQRRVRSLAKGGELISIPSTSI
eukprot:scaffold803_cov310-Pinguiococcus_pyrenoidosus.AAC.20